MIKNGIKDSILLSKVGIHLWKQNKIKCFAFEKKNIIFSHYYVHLKVPYVQ